MPAHEAGQTGAVKQAGKTRGFLVPPDTRTEMRIGLLLIVFSHACDLLSTYWRTPDLSREASPAYAALSQAGWSGWSALLMLKVVGVLLTAALFVFYIRKRRDFYPAEAGRSFHEFLHDVHAQKAMRRPDGSWVAPSPMLLAVWMAFTASIGSAAYAYFLAIHNMLGTPVLVWLANSVAPAAIFMISAIAFWRTLYHDYTLGNRP